METLAEYKDFWSDIRSKIIGMRSLKIWQEREEARVSYEYPIEPTVPEKLIKQFEARNKLELPLSYRSYLLYFGGSGPCEYGCTNSFVKTISKADVSTPAEIEIFEDIRDTDLEPHLIESGNGTVAIAIDSNPTVPFLVLNGKARGYVYWHSQNSVVVGEGEFAVWYKRWVDEKLAAVERRHTIFSTPIGISRQELAAMYSRELIPDDRDGIEFLCHRESSVAFILDANEHVQSIQLLSEFFRQCFLDRQSEN